MRKLFPFIVVVLLLTVGWVIVSQAAPPEVGAEKAAASVDAAPLRQTVPVTISIDPASKTVISGTFDFLWNIKVEAGEDGVDAVQAYVNFDPDYLRVVDDTGAETDEIIADTSSLDVVVVNSADNLTGHINYAAVTLGAEPTGDFNIASIRFRAVAVGTTTVSFNLVAPRETKATLGGAERTVSTSDGTVIIEEVPRVPTDLTLTPDSQKVTVGGSAILTATVEDQYGNSVADGTSVSFSTVPAGIGKLTSPVSTTGGVAVSTLSGITTPMTVTVRAWATGYYALVFDLATVVFIPGKPVSLELTPESQTVLVGKSATLTATVVDTYTNPVADYTSVSFATVPAGIGVLVTPVSTTGGVAVSTLSGITTPMTVTVRARATGVFPFVQDTATVIFEEPPVVTVVTLTADPTDPTVDDTCTLTAVVEDQRGDPIPDGTEVVFQTDLGLLDGVGTEVTKTTTDGLATAELTSIAVGTATVTATADTVSDSATVVFGWPEVDHFDIATISSPQTAGEPFTVTITAKSAGGTTVPTFTGPVTLTDTTGTINPTVTGPFVEGVWSGQVTICGLGWTRITATYDGATGQSNYFRVDIGLLDLTLEADPDSLIVGTTSTLTATVADECGNPAPDGTEVVLETDLGLLDGSGSVVTKTTTSGIATAELTSTEVGIATVIATSDTLSDTATVTFNPGPPIRVDLTPDTETVTAGDSVTYELTAYDAYDNSWDVTAEGSYSIDTDAGGSWADNVYTSEWVGTWTVTAEYDSLSDTATLTVDPDEATQWDILDVVSDPQYVNEPFTIVVQAWDQYGNKAVFAGTATLADTTGTIAPTSVSVVDGEGTAEVTISAAQDGVTIIVSGEGLTPDTSNAFDVMWRYKLFLPVVMKVAS